MITTVRNIVLLKVEDKSFKSSEGKDVVFKEATLLDDDGNKFSCTVDADAYESVEGKESAKGEATLALFVRTNARIGKEGKPYSVNELKMRLIGFEAD